MSKEIVAAQLRNDTDILVPYLRQERVISGALLKQDTCIGITLLQDIKPSGTMGLSLNSNERIFVTQLHKPAALLQKPISRTIDVRDDNSIIIFIRIADELRRRKQSVLPGVITRTFGPRNERRECHQNDGEQNPESDQHSITQVIDLRWQYGRGRIAQRPTRRLRSPE